METSKRATVYFDPQIHRALRLKAAVTERSISELVNEGVELALGEDAEDLEVFAQRRDGPPPDRTSERSIASRGGRQATRPSGCPAGDALKQEDLQQRPIRRQPPSRHTVAV